ncbi:MAG: BatA domain-containing protein [Planctomycetota bacterium]|nr:BatA domain-containing protein [Planctomycetota bacterium]
MFPGFLNPALLAGLGLAAVPLVIHLLNRRRYRPLPWAAMRFVQAAYRKTRRRVQLENLLLLLLRMAGIACLALAVARPFSGGASPLSALGEARRELILVLDASGSTGFRSGLHSSFDRILGRARELLTELDTARGDRVHLLLAGSHTRRLSRGGPDEALSILTTLQEPTDERLDLAAALGEVLTILREDLSGLARSGSPAQIRLLCDLQRNDFTSEAVALAAAGDSGGAGAVNGTSAANNSTGNANAAANRRELLDELQALGARVLVEDLGPDPAIPPNVGLTSITVLGPAPRAGSRGVLAVGVTNHGLEAQTSLRLSLESDSGRLPSQQLSIPGGQRVEALFEVGFPRAGQMLFTAQLEGDGLALDDQRTRVIPVAPPVRVLLVNGASSADLQRDAVGLLRAVLEPTPGGLGSTAAEGINIGGAGGSSGTTSRAGPFQVSEVRPDELATLDLTGWDVIVLANVARPSASWVEKLERRVATGGALWIGCGPRLDPAAYNRLFFRPDGTGLLPAELGPSRAVADRRTSWFRVADFATTHPALSFFADEIWRPLLTEVPIFEFQDAHPLPTTTVLATLDDGDRSPLLMERTFDRGRVVLWTSSLDPSWTRLPESPASLVPLTHELLRHLARRREPARNGAPGATLALESPTWPRSPQWSGPDSTRRPLEGEATQTPVDTWLLPALEGPQTARAGAYHFILDGGAQEAFAIQSDPAEGDLARLTLAELGTVHRALTPVDGQARERNATADHDAEGELWRWLAAAALCAVALETLLAAWLGTRRRLL